MARARSIKPGFFLNDELAELEPLTRLLFAGLWTVADRAGRLHDRPKKIKAAILPYDNHDIDAALNALQSRGFISRYVVDEVAAIQIHNWSKHQYPHLKEPASVIAEQPLSKNQSGTRRAPDKNGAHTASARHAKTVEHEADAVDASGEHEAKTPGTYNHNLDTGTGYPVRSVADATPADDGPSPFDTDDVDTRSPLAIVIDIVKAAGVAITTTGRDGKALKDSGADPREVAACFIAIARGEWGDDFTRRRLAVHVAVESLNGWRARDVKPAPSSRPLTNASGRPLARWEIRERERTEAMREAQRRAAQ